MKTLKVALKYCGSCNPQIDLSRIASNLAEKARREGKIRFVPFSNQDVDVLIILCGCPRACANKEHVKARARHTILVAGENLCGRPVPENNLLTSIEDKLRKNILLSSDKTV